MKFWWQHLPTPLEPLTPADTYVPNLGHQIETISWKIEYSAVTCYWKTLVMNTTNHLKLFSTAVLIKWLWNLTISDKWTDKSFAKLVIKIVNFLTYLSWRHWLINSHRSGVQIQVLSSLSHAKSPRRMTWPRPFCTQTGSTQWITSLQVESRKSEHL